MTEDIVFEIIAGICIFSVTTILPLCIYYMKRTERMLTQNPQPTLPVPDIIARLQRMETGMESMSAEIERIGEGQRFTTRLLSEREPRQLETADAKNRSA
ncbi:MAG: hypothetical protein ABI035_04580 [Gemmatimonadaceae bacterium]